MTATPPPNKPTRRRTAGKPHPMARLESSIGDVAREAGVSTATVSRVINSPALVAGETAERVRAAIAKLGYKPNPFAKGLMTRKSQVLGIALPDIHGEFYSELLRGADEEAAKLGYNLLVSSEARRRGSETPETSASRMAVTFGFVEGLALMIAEPNAELWKQATGMNLPLVVLDSEMSHNGKQVDCIVIDSAGGATEATEHLCDKVAPDLVLFVGGPETNFDTRRRAEAFTAALKARKQKPAPHQLSFKEYTEAWGYDWAQKMHRDGRLKGSGVLCANDEIAMGVLNAASDAGLSVPRDLRIVGFDDTRLASLVRPKLSSVRVPMFEVGAAAVRALVQRIASPESPVATLRVPTKLVARESSR